MLFYRTLLFCVFLSGASINICRKILPGGPAKFYLDKFSINGIGEKDESSSNLLSKIFHEIY